MRSLFVFAALIFSVSGLHAGDLSPEAQAKFVKVILAAAHSDKIACSDPALATALQTVNIKVDPGSMIIWTNNPGEARSAKAAGRLVISGKKDLINFASVVVMDESGPKLFINPTNMNHARVQLSDAVRKIGSSLE